MLQMLREAADEIERLWELLQMSYPDQHAEIERLRAALEWVETNSAEPNVAHYAGEALK